MPLDRETALLAAMIEGPAWTEQFVPRLVERAEELRATLARAAAGDALHPARAAAYCAGALQALEWVQRWPREIVQDAVIREGEEKILAEREFEYETRARNGYTYPYVENVDGRRAE